MWRYTTTESSSWKNLLWSTLMLMFKRLQAANLRLIAKADLFREPLNYKKTNCRACKPLLELAITSAMHIPYQN